MKTPAAMVALGSVYYRQQQETARAAATAVQERWRGLPSGASLPEQWEWWYSAAPLMADDIARAQFTNAERSADYLALMAAFQNLPSDTVAMVNPLAFVSATEDTLLDLEAGMGAYTYRRLQGSPESRARFSGAASLVRTAATFAQDSGREATGVGIAGTPTLQGYTRMTVGDTCPRCAILAGATYKWSAGFERHPLCDCVHVPSAEWFDDGTQDFGAMLEDGRVSLPEADTKAILEDGADPSQIVNAKRGLQTARIYGRDVQTSTVGTTTRGLAGTRLKAGYAKQPGSRYRVSKAPRITPAEIYRQAESREHAQRLLFRNGYVVNG